MTNDKRKRLKSAVIVGAVLFLIIIMSIVIYQCVSISARKKRVEFLEAEIQRYYQLIEQGEETIELRSLREWIEVEARELGYIWDTDKELG